MGLGAVNGPCSGGCRLDCLAQGEGMVFGILCLEMFFQHPFQRLSCVKLEHGVASNFRSTLLDKPSTMKNLGYGLSRDYHQFFGLSRVAFMKHSSHRAIGLVIMWMWVKMEDLGDHRC